MLEWLLSRDAQRHIDELATKVSKLSVALDLKMLECDMQGEQIVLLRKQVQELLAIQEHRNRALGINPQDDARGQSQLKVG